jgi:Holliday junction resolvase RusA-like endonuclease
MNTISFVIPLEPKSLQFSGKRLMIRAGKPMFFKTSKASSYQSTITLLSRKYAPKQPLEGPIKVDFIFILPRPKNLFRKSDPEGLIPCDKRPDIDNLRKGTQDAIKGFWKDDGQIYSGETMKFYAEKNGAARIVVNISK